MQEAEDEVTTNQQVQAEDTRQEEELYVVEEAGEETHVQEDRYFLAGQDYPAMPQTLGRLKMIFG